MSNLQKIRLIVSSDEVLGSYGDTLSNLFWIYEPLDKHNETID